MVEEMTLPVVPAQTTPAIEPPTVITNVTPSPSASPIPIIAQFQEVTSYVPVITVCALPPLAYFSGSFSDPVPTGPPDVNYSASIPSGSGTCLTTYSPTLTPICYSILAGIASEITVTDCSQHITFSSASSYKIEFPDTPDVVLNRTTPLPLIQTLETFYVAPWEELTTPGLAPQFVEKEVCTKYANGTTICTDTMEEWTVETITKATTITSAIDLYTTVSGPAKVMIETW